MVKEYSNASGESDANNKTVYFKLTDDIYLNDVGGTGNCIICDGVFKPGTSTVHYANCAVNDTVAAINYYNLDLQTTCPGSPQRTFANKGVAIGIAGDFIPGNAVCNVTNSTVEFNGEFSSLPNIY